MITGYHDLASLREKALAADYEGEVKAAPAEQVETPLELRSPEAMENADWREAARAASEARTRSLAASEGRKAITLLGLLPAAIKSTTSS